MTINVTFDPSVVVMDTTSSEYIYAKNNGKTTETTISGETYVNSISFEIDAEESKVIKFYKLDSSKDYTLAENDSTISVEGII
jgi:tetrahydromethanopterin S-methyltransferase subunit H